jgi:DNA-binding PadR family transcriptional regulator
METDMRIRFGRDGCNSFDVRDAVMAMTMGRGWKGGWGPGGGGWSFDFGGPGGPGGGRGQRGRRMFESGELRLVLLRLIADQPRHGYDLIRAIEEMTHGTYGPSPGVVYPTLTMLQDMGLIEEAAAEAGGTRKLFTATAEGRAHLADKAEEVDALMSRLSGLGDDQRRVGGAPIKRAVGNLLAALWHRVSREELNEDRLHEIAEILDEAARKIERLK